jgi:hypothetical protein
MLARIVRDPVWRAVAPLLPTVDTTGVDTAVEQLGGQRSSPGVAHALLVTGDVHVCADGCGRYEVVHGGTVVHSSSSYAQTRDALLCHAVCIAFVAALDGVARTYATRVCGTSVVVGALDSGPAAAAAPAPAAPAVAAPVEIVVTLMPRPGAEGGVVGMLVAAGGAGGGVVSSTAVQVEVAWLLKSDFQGLLQRLTHAATLGQ